MNILIDIGHPAHVHYFKNIINIFIRKGHKILVTARDKEITFNLLKHYNINFKNIGKNKFTLIGKILSIIRNDYKILLNSLKFKPDIFLSDFLPFTAHVGFLLKKPVIGFTDTEHAKWNIRLAKPFTDIILTPECFKKYLGRKQIRLNTYLELFYLHPNYYRSDKSILKFLGIDKNEKYIILRFVSWNAAHDFRYKGLSLEMKRKAVKELSKYAKVFISSESKLPKDLKSFELQIPPEKMHDVLYYASLYFGDSGTMASECAVLGTPAINIATSALEIGVFYDISKYGLMYIEPNENKALRLALKLLKDYSLKNDAMNKKIKLLSEKIDVTAFIVWFIENYPESVRIMKENPDYQFNFK